VAPFDLVVAQLVLQEIPICTDIFEIYVSMLEMDLRKSKKDLNFFTIGTQSVSAEIVHVPFHVLPVGVSQ
jgi:hypothetical protein